MSEEDILRLIDNYEVEVEGKVSQAAFPYPPMTPQMITPFVMREYGPSYDTVRDERIQNRQVDQAAEYEHHLRKMILSDMQIKMDQQFINLGPTFT